MSSMAKATWAVWRVFSDCATWLGTYPSCCTAASTRATISAFDVFPLSARDTEEIDTPATLATSWIVGRRRCIEINSSETFPAVATSRPWKRFRDVPTFKDPAGLAVKPAIPIRDRDGAGAGRTWARRRWSGFAREGADDEMLHRQQRTEPRPARPPVRDVDQAWLEYVEAVEDRLELRSGTEIRPAGRTGRHHLGGLHGHLVVLVLRVEGVAECDVGPRGQGIDVLTHDPGRVVSAEVQARQ